MNRLTASILAALMLALMSGPGAAQLSSGGYPQSALPISPNAVASQGQGALPGVQQPSTSGQTMPGQAAPAQPLAQPPALLTQQPPETIKPFGASLFAVKSAVEGGGLPNPDYKVAIGDKVNVQIWGAVTFQGVLTVDNQGNIMLPGVGPVKLLDLPSGRVTQRVESAVRQTYKAQVHVYTSVETVKPLAVYVTGFVNAPGRYAGTATDSVLYFLDRAQGIDLRRGSFRKIEVMRGDKLVSKVDLYDFLLHGRLPSIQLRENDVILVRPRGQFVAAKGLVQNEAEFEMLGDNMTGAELLEFANPDQEASHVFIGGVRGDENYSRYTSLRLLKNHVLRSGDSVTFIRDRKTTSFFVTAEGAYVGQSTFPVQRGMWLSELLNYIAIDPEVARLDSVYLIRRSIKERQQALLEQNIRQLRETLFKQSPISVGDAEIRVREMQLLENFLNRSGLTEASGRLIINRGGRFSDTLLEEGDVVLIPRRENVVYISGEVNAPQSIIYDESLTLDDYIRLAGGLSGRGDSDEYIIYHVNGEVSREVDHINPGDRILMMPKITIKSFQFAIELTDVLYKIALASVALTR